VDITPVRLALADNLSAISGIQVSAYMLPNPTPPTVHIYPAEIQYDLAMDRGMDLFYLTVQALSGSPDDRAAQQNLDAYLSGDGEQSFKAAIEADRTLGGSCDDLIVESMSGYRLYSFQDRAPALGAEWRVRIIG